MIFIYRVLFLSGLIFIPIAINLGGTEDAPIDILWGDFAVVALLLPIVAKFSIDGFPKVSYLYFVFLFFCIFIACFTSLLRQDISPILSMSRFVKSTLIFIVGCYYGRRFSLMVFFYRIPFAVFSFFLILLLSDVVFNPAFPYGRWGGKVFDLDVYAFPNAAAGFYAIISYFLLGRLFLESGTRRAIWLSAILIAGAICVLSLSRNAAFTYFVAVFLSILSVRSHVKKYFYFICVVITALLVMYIYMPYFSSNAGLIHKLSSTIGENPLSGRDDVWKIVFSLVLDSPIFGYGFYSFSNYAGDIKTTHNMILDIMYKAGFLGLVLYLLVLIRPLYYYYKHPFLKKNEDFVFIVPCYGALFFLVILSGFSQETLSYSVNQMLFFYMAGHLTVQLKLAMQERNFS